MIDGEDTLRISVDLGNSATWRSMCEGAEFVRVVNKSGEEIIYTKSHVRAATNGVPHHRWATTWQGNVIR